MLNSRKDLLSIKRTFSSPLAIISTNPCGSIIFQGTPTVRDCWSMTTTGTSLSMVESSWSHSQVKSPGIRCGAAAGDGDYVSGQNGVVPDSRAGG